LPVASVVVALAVSVGPRPAVAAVQFDAAQLKAILRTAEPEDKGFIERVVTLANTGRLGRYYQITAEQQTQLQQILPSTVIWARRKPKHRFQYFKQAMIQRAADVGITFFPQSLKNSGGTS
jgi:hypothetical protein